MALIAGKHIDVPPFYVIVGNDPGTFMRGQDDQLALWVYEHRPGEGKFFWTYNLAEDTWEQVRLVEGMSDETPRPTFTVPYNLVAPLVAALTDYRPPDQAMQRHLDDTVQVRDRLLTLVETLAPHPLLPLAGTQLGRAPE